MWETIETRVADERNMARYLMDLVRAHLDSAETALGAEGLPFPEEITRQLGEEVMKLVASLGRMEAYTGTEQSL